MKRVDQGEWAKLVEQAVWALTHLHTMATQQIGIFSEDPLATGDVKSLQQRFHNASAATQEVEGHWMSCEIRRRMEASGPRRG